MYKLNNLILNIMKLEQNELFYVIDLINFILG